MRNITIATMIALGLTLGGCGTSNRGLESVHQPVVKRTDYVLDVASGGLTAADSERLSCWFESLQLGYGDRVAVDMPGGFGDDDTRRAVAALAGQYGLLLDTTAPLTAGDLSPGSVRVVVSRMKASVPGFKKFAAVLNAHLAGCNYVACARLTIADFQLASMATDWRESEMPMAGFPHVVRWIDDLMRIPAWAHPWPPERHAGTPAELMTRRSADRSQIAHSQEG